VVAEFAARVAGWIWSVIIGRSRSAVAARL
jgi:hypothetical protein